MRILLVGDVFGAMGRTILKQELPRLRQQYGINFVVVNGENIAHGKGIIEKYYKELLALNVDVVTLGNHAFSNKGVFQFIDDAKRLVRPLNYKTDVPGVGYVTVNYNGIKITVMQLLGRVFMAGAEQLTNPFTVCEELLNKLDSDIYICDFHGEATSEKNAFGLYFDGRIHIIVGTHTHVATNDAHILPNGSMYITDLGMVGALDGVIGVNPDPVIHQYLTDEHIRHLPMEKGRQQFNALMVEINEQTHKITKYESINLIQK